MKNGKKRFLPSNANCDCSVIVRVPVCSGQAGCQAFDCKNTRQSHSKTCLLLHFLQIQPANNPAYRGNCPNSQRAIKNTSRPPPMVATKCRVSAAMAMDASPASK